MKKYEVRAWIEEIGVIPAVRVRSPEDALFAVEAIAQGGIPIAEITLTVPGAIKIISQLRKENPNMVVGAGGVHGRGNGSAESGRGRAVSHQRRTAPRGN